MAQVEIELKCSRGKNVAGDIIKVDKAVADIMIAEASGKLSVERKVGETKAEKALQTRVVGLTATVTGLEAKLKASEEAEVASTATITGLEAKLKAKK